MESKKFEIELDRLCAEMKIENDSEEYFQALNVLNEEITIRKVNGVGDEISEVVDVMLSWRGREELSCERKELLEEISKMVSISRTAYVWMVLREVLNSDYGEGK